MRYIIQNFDNNFYFEAMVGGVWLPQDFYNKNDATKYLLKEAEVKAKELNAQGHGVRILALTEREEQNVADEQNL